MEGSRDAWLAVEREDDDDEESSSRGTELLECEDYCERGSGEVE